jgi:glycosyltransferase involved in cell wall biosynthesis
MMSKLRILVLGQNVDPTDISVPLVGYSHAAALAEIHHVTLVIGSPVEDRVRSTAANFHNIEVVRMDKLERMRQWGFRRIFKSNYDSQALTAFAYPFTVAFEWFAWRQLRKRIFAGEFDVVMRVVPVTAVLPSAFAFFMRKTSIPFVIGPLNGGLPWPPGFSQLQRQKEWVSGLRNLYAYLPFARATYRHAAAIIVASSNTHSEFSAHRDKLFFIPENAIRRALCCEDTRRSEPGAKLKLLFVGGLVPRKACDVGLRAAAPLLRNGTALFTVIGDGPERGRLEQLVKSLGVDNAVEFCGWLPYAEAIKRMRQADVFVFPSVRDFGGGVVFESLASGAVPLVVDFGGPGDTIFPEIGFKVPLTNENDIVEQMERILGQLAQDRNLIAMLRKQGMTYARERLTWEAKAQDTTKVLRWVVQKGPKPELVPPSELAAVFAPAPRAATITTTHAKTSNSL